ncbi:hypothetical protein [Paracidovorax valerianellae]|uniref:Uncharacterized protein n=1 Tax=Paracidovorax valerianellae TaxID=187868 RepID=A0A1G6S9L8_9BURK|nr:hypothetical protein [Paracidovorax valerianellae]MDA8444231.1 hypothetical protein [Paracidovorax valerianellae]SDD13630.1 hypothetical protein SAMN05192589_104383 [Paracidovorax valerianellae]
MKYSKRAKIFLFGALGLMAAFLLFLVFAWSTFDVSEVGRNSMTYRLAAPEHLQDVEIIGECSSPKYRWKGRDGTAAPFSSLNYGSSAPATDIFKRYRQKFLTQSCTPETLTPAPDSEHMLSMTCTNKDFLEAKVFVAKQGECKTVTVDFLDND